MHVLFVHQNYPAQFGHIARHLVERHGYRCTYVSKLPGGRIDGLERIQYRLEGGASKHNHYCSRTFENAVWHTDAVYKALRERPDVQPDLVVGHSGFGSTLFLRELYDCPIVNYFEYFYRSKNSDMDFRPQFGASEINNLRSYTRNAMLLLDLENCDVGYSPTEWQRSRLPELFHEKVRVVFDGVDTGLWQRNPNVARRLLGRDVPPDVKIVTYVSRGMEAMRGFDIFMKVAKRLCDERDDVVFAVVGEDRVCYGGDHAVIGDRTFKQWVLDQDDYDLSRFSFLGVVPAANLVDVFSMTDLHVYLTAPFVLSWSLMNALSCGAPVLASDTAPVREMITDSENGLLVDFFDVDAFVARANKVLDEPQQFRALGAAAAETIRKHYSLDVSLPQLLRLYEDAHKAYRRS